MKTLFALTLMTFLPASALALSYGVPSAPNANTSIDPNNPAPVYIDLTHMQMARTIYATMNKVWKTTGCENVTGNEIVNNSLYMNQCLNKEFLYKERRMKCKSDSNPEDLSNCTAVEDYVAYNQNKWEPCNDERDKLAHQYKCGELRLGNNVWSERRPEFIWASPKNYIATEVSCVGYTNTTNRSVGPQPNIPICAAGSNSACYKYVRNVYKCYNMTPDFTAVTERRYIKYLAASNTGRDEKQLASFKAIGGNFRFLVGRLATQLESKKTFFSLDLAKRAQTSGYPSTVTTNTLASNQMPQAYLKTFPDDRDTPRPYEEWLPMANYKAINNDDNWRKLPEYASYYKWQHSEYLTLCVLLPGMSLRVPSTQVGITGVDSVQLGNVKLRDIETCALVRLMYKYTPGTVGSMGPSFEVISVLEPRFALPEHTDFHVDLKWWADLLTLGIGEMLFNVVGSAVVDTGLAGHSAIPITRTLASFAGSEKGKAATAQVMTAWKGVEDDVIKSFNDSTKNLRTTITTMQAAITQSCSKAVYPRVYNQVYATSPGSTTQRTALAKAAANTAAAKCATAASLPFVYPDMRHNEGAPECYSSYFEGLQVVYKKSDGTIDQPWWQRATLSTPGTAMDTGCRIRLRLALPPTPEGAKAAQYLSCAARIISNDANYMSDKYSEAMSTTLPYFVDKEEARDATMAKIQQSCTMTAFHTQAGGTANGGLYDFL